VNKRRRKKANKKAATRATILVAVLGGDIAKKVPRLTEAEERVVEQRK
jgi:hypothetical protein